MRKTLNPGQVGDKATTAIAQFHPDIVNEVEAAVQSNKIVVVGMAQNPVVSKARKLLGEKNMEYKYLEYGSYFSKWKERLAIKLWSGWPTYPMVFMDGKLIGGARELGQTLGEKNS